MKTFVISLRRTPERLRRFVAINSGKVSYEIFDAFDGSGQNCNAVNVEEFFGNRDDFKAGELGNALSHMKLWEIAIQSDTPITICEDDAILNRDFCSMVEHLIDTKGDDWDYIAWGWNFDSLLAGELIPLIGPFCAFFSQEELRRNWFRFIDSDIHASLFKLHNCFGTLCYSISPGGARKFLELIKPMRVENVFIPGLNNSIPSNTLDVVMNKHYINLNCFVSFPPLAISLNDHSKSTVVNV
jgi:glycosyl transferase, family 25